MRAQVISTSYRFSHSTLSALSPARWRGKHTYLSSLGLLGTTQLNSIFIVDHIKFNNGYMKRADTRQRMTNNNKENKFDTSVNPGLLYCATIVTLKFKLK